MAIVGTTIFSHILPVIFGFFGFVMIIAGSLEDNNPKLGLGIALFVIACIFPYVVLSVLV
jgi:Zn-dependent membrane protease YugP